MIENFYDYVKISENYKFFEILNTEKNPQNFIDIFIFLVQCILILFLDNL